MAFMWTCPECGRDNFERTISIENAALSQQDKEEIIEQLQLDGPEELEEMLASGREFALAPKDVNCPHCKQNFNTIDPGDTDGY